MSDIAPIKLSGLSGTTLLSTSSTVGIDATYDPERFLPGGVARWVDRSGGIALGYPSITLSVRPPTKESRVYKVSGKLFRPVLETVDPATGIFGPRLGYTNQAHLDVMIHERATSAEKLVLFNHLKSLLFVTITASDGSPTDASGSPFPAAILTQEDVY